MNREIDRTVPGQDVDGRAGRTGRVGRRVGLGWRAQVGLNLGLGQVRAIEVLPVGRGRPAAG